MNGPTREDLDRRLGDLREKEAKRRKQGYSVAAIEKEKAVIKLKIKAL